MKLIEISFELSGGGKIVGVASGDLTNYDSFKSTKHSALKGKVLVILQAPKSPLYKTHRYRKKKESVTATINFK